MSHDSQSLPNSSNNASGSNSACQYAAAALGVGLVVLGMVMILWSVLPANAAMNNSQSVDEQENKSTSSVGIVLLGTGAAMLLLSFFLAAQNKYRARRQQHNTNTHPGQRQNGERPPNQSEQFTVPTYEEVIGSDQYPIRQFSPRLNSTTQLPAYEEVIERTQDVPDSSDQTQTAEGDSNPATQPPQSPHKKNSVGLNTLPLKVRIKSCSSTPQFPVSSIEPLTPPPQYEEHPPQLALPVQ